MADVKISAMTGAGTLDGTEKVPVIQGGANKAATVGGIADFMPPFSNHSGTTWDGSYIRQTLSGDLAITLSTTRNSGLARITGNGHNLTINGVTINLKATGVTLVGYVRDGTEYDFDSNAATTTGGGGGPTPPTVIGMVATDATHIDVTFSQTVTAASLSGWSFKKNGSALAASSVSAITGTVWEFVVATMVNTDTIQASYNSGTGAVQNLSGDPLASFTDSSVTNSIGASFDIWNDIPWVQAYNSDLSTYLAGSAATDGGNVDEWRDTKHPGAIPNTWSFQQGDGTKQPVLRSTGINSKKAIEVSHDGTNAHYLPTDVHTGVAPTMTFIYVNKLKTMPGGYKILRSSAPDCNSYINGSNGKLAIYAGSLVDTSYTMVVDEDIIIEEVWKSGGGADVYVNGISVGSALAAGTAPTVVKNIMGSADGSCGHFYRRHLFVLDRELTSGERTNVTNWLKTDNGIA